MMGCLWWRAEDNSSTTHDDGDLLSVPQAGRRSPTSELSHKVESAHSLPVHSITLGPPVKSVIQVNARVPVALHCFHLLIITHTLQHIPQG